MYSITLQTNDTVVSSGDILGRLQFAASAEADGGASQLIGAGIYGMGEGSFGSSSNPASLVFITSADDSNAAVPRIKISEDGDIIPIQGSHNIGEPGNSFNTIYATGLDTRYIALASNVPADTTNKLYNDNGTLKFNGSSIGGAGGGGLNDLIDDTSPQLGANLDINTHSITGVGNIDIDGDLSANSGNFTALSVNAGNGGFVFPIGDGNQGQVLKTDGNGNIAWATDNTATGGGSTLSIYHTGVQVGDSDIAILDFSDNFTILETPDTHINISLTGVLENVVEDTSPQLGGNLDLNSYSITGVGNINIDGDITAENFYGDLDGPIVVECKNQTGSDIAAGTPVYVSGYYGTNGKASVAPADATDPSKMPAIGIIATALTSDSEGHVHCFGLVTHINTESLSVGDTVYVASGGGLTNSRPSGATELVQNIGRVLRSDSSQGRILVLGPGRTNDTPNSLDITGTITAPNIGTGEDDSVVVLDSDGKLRTDEIDSRVWGTSLVDGNGTSNYLSKWSDSDTLTSGIIYDDGINVGVGTLTPSYKLEVNGDIGLTDSGFYASPTGVMVGTSGWLYNDGQTTLSHGNFIDNGDAQNSSYVLRTSTTDGAFTTIQNNGSDVILAPNRTMMFTANIVARRTNGQDNAAYKLEGALINDDYGASILGTPVKTTLCESDSSWDVQAIISGAGAGASNYLLIQGKGAASKNINWICKLDLLEVGDGWTPYSLGSSLALWLDATATHTVTLNGSSVSAWGDKSGNGHSLAQDTAARQPTFGASQINGKPAVIYTDAGEALQSTAFNLGTDAADHSTTINVFSVGKFTSSVTSTSFLFDGNNNSNERFFGRWVVGAGVRFQSVTRNINEGDGVGEENSTSQAIVPGTNPWLINVENNRQGNSSFIRHDGTDVSPSSCEFGEEGFDGLVVGNSIYRTQSLLGLLGEFLIVSGTLSQSEREKIEGYLAHKWGFTANLPSSHPYKTVAP